MSLGPVFVGQLFVLNLKLSIFMLLIDIQRSFFVEI